MKILIFKLRLFFSKFKKKKENKSSEFIYEKND